MFTRTATNVRLGQVSGGRGERGWLKRHTAMPARYGAVGWGPTDAGASGTTRPWGQQGGRRLRHMTIRGGYAERLPALEVSDVPALVERLARQVVTRPMGHRGLRIIAQLRRPPAALRQACSLPAGP